MHIRDAYVTTLKIEHDGDIGWWRPHRQCEGVMGWWGLVLPIIIMGRGGRSWG